MSKIYSNLLSPIKVGNVVFKNRLTATLSEPHYIQGDETFPTEQLIKNYANKAKNGAAIVTCSGPISYGRFPVVLSQNGYDWYRLAFEGKDPRVMPVSKQESYLCQLTEAIHFYGSKASTGLFVEIPDQYDVSTGSTPIQMQSKSIREREEIPVKVMEQIADEYALQAAFMKAMGFDMIFMHMSYQIQLIGRFLSPVTNRRKDEFGGSVENRARFPIMVADRIKQKCGKDFLIEAAISGEELMEGGQTLQDTIEFAKLFAGHFDLLQLRAGDVDSACPSGFITETTPFLYMAEAVKKSGANIAVVTSGGYQDLDINEKIIASGQSDFIAMARTWVSNPDYGRKAAEGRGEDVVPCIRCNKCHHNNKHEPLTSVCSVNPIWGLEHQIDHFIDPPNMKKKVAVIGGGPAGMEAAIVASSRGHNVTLYEKSDKSGGLLNTTDNVSFKWPLKNFKNYLIRQVNKANVQIRMNTEVTPEMLKNEEYDTILAAVGSEPSIPPIPGIESSDVIFAKDVYGNEDKLAKDVIVIGGGEMGVETGIHLGEKGYKVTLIEMLDILAVDAAPVEFSRVIRGAFINNPNCKAILNARCTDISANKVTYEDAEGKKHEVEAESIIISIGMKPKNDLALTFSKSADEFFLIGDCTVAGNVQKVMRSAFSIASMI